MRVLILSAENGQAGADPIDAKAAWW